MVRGAMSTLIPVYTRFLRRIWAENGFGSASREAARRATMAHWSSRLETPLGHPRVGMVTARDLFLQTDAGPFQALSVREVPALIVRR